MITTTESPPVGQLYGHRGFPGIDSSVPAARLWLSARLEDLRVAREHAFVVELVAGELTANAVRHAGTGFELLVYRPHEGLLHLAVRDWNTRLPVPRDAGLEAEGGRGLGLVRGYAFWWGVTLHADGKTVAAAVSLVA